MINLNSIYSNFRSEDIFLIESILEEFIPFFKEINEIENINIGKLINELIFQIGNSNCFLKNKKKKNIFTFDNSLKLEEKDFLYKTYISSSETNHGTVKFCSEDTLKINNISIEMVRSLLILIKEEITTNSNQILLQKLSYVKKLVINEYKTFDFKILYVLLNLIVLKFCKNLEEINFEGTFYSRVDQIDLMLKNGVYLYFIYKSSSINKLLFINKIEFLNENVSFKIFHDYCTKNSISDINAEKIEYNKINIFSILPMKQNLKILVFKKILIDKNSLIQSIINLINFNKNLNILSIDKFVSIPDHFRSEIIQGMQNLTNLKKLKINIISSSKEDFIFMNLPRTNNSITKFYLKLSRVCLENDSLIESYFNFKETNLEKLSLRLEKFSPNFSDNLCNFISNNLQELSLGMIDHITLDKFTKLAKNLTKLHTLKLFFYSINEDHYEEAYKNIIFLLENCRFIKNFHFENFVIKYKNMFDEDIKEILKDNIKLKKLIIRSDMPFHVQYFEGYYYYEYPKFTIEPILFCFKKSRDFSKIYFKKSITTKVFDFQRIKKEKLVVISYKV